MENIAAWAADNWIDLLQSAGIIASLILSAYTLRLDVKSRWVENKLTVTHHHRELWHQLTERPELARILDPRVNLSKNPATIDEERFVKQVILHLNAHHFAIKQGLAIKPEGLEEDIESFFSLPIPRVVWKKTRHLRDQAFVKSVESVP